MPNKEHSNNVLLNSNESDNTRGSSKVLSALGNLKPINVARVLKVLCKTVLVQSQLLDHLHITSKTGR